MSIQQKQQVSCKLQPSISHNGPFLRPSVAVDVDGDVVVAGRPSLLVWLLVMQWLQRQLSLASRVCATFEPGQISSQQTNTQMIRWWPTSALILCHLQATLWH